MFIDFFNFIKSFEIFFIFETHITNENSSIFTKYFNGYKLFWIPATKTSLRGRASGGCLYGIQTSKLKLYAFVEIENNIVVKLLQKPNMFIIPLYINCNNWTEDFNRLYNLMSDLSSKSVMLIGDFNARIGDNQVKTQRVIPNISPLNINKRTSKDNICNQNGMKLLEMLQIYDTIILNGCTDGDSEGNFTFVGGQGKSVIDYCMVNNDWTNLIQKFEVFSKHFSDHMPLVVEWESHFEPQQRPLSLMPRLKWKTTNLDTYHHYLDNYLLNNPSTNQSTAALSIQLTECIRNSSINPNPHIRNSSTQKWFDIECLNARKKSFALLKAFRKCSCDEIRKWYVQANLKYKKMCLVKKINFESMQAKSLSQIKNTKQFWKIAKEINSSHNSIGLSVSADDLSDYFKNLLQSNLTTTFSYAQPLICDEILDSVISINEIQYVLQRARDGKAPGEDGIPYEFFKNASPTFYNHLLTFFNKIFENADVPPSFKKSVIFPIHKKGDLNAVENYRGISFMNVIAKIFCGVLVNRLENWVDSNDILTELQAGFRRNYSTVDHIFTLTSIAKAFQARHKKLYTLFVDFKAAFDLVNRNTLFYKLSKIGVSTKFIQIIRCLYTDTKAAVWDGNTYSKPFKSLTGVKQGCLLSALLFALFINDIADYIPGGVRIAGITINVLLYADDLLLLSESPETLQLMINRLTDYCNKWGLVINTEKSKVMVFSRSSRGAIGNNWVLNGCRLEVSNDYKYLGVLLNPTLDYNKHLAEKSKTSQSLINMTWKKIFSNNHINHSTKFKIFNAVVKSSLFYAAQVWGMQEFEEIEKLQRNFLKKIFNIPLNAPNYSIYLETGLPKFFTSTLKLQADYLTKVFDLQETRLCKIMMLYEIRNKDWWLRTWENIAASCGENLQVNPNNTSAMRIKFYEIIQKLEDLNRNQMIEKACQSESRLLYSQLNHNLCSKNYFQDTLSYKDISLIYKIRCELLNLNGTPYNGSFDPFCSLCNLRSKEDCFHFISVCPIFNPQRRTYFGKSTLSVHETIDILNGSDWTKLVKFVRNSYHYRGLLITEYE